MCVHVYVMCLYVLVVYMYVWIQISRRLRRLDMSQNSLEHLDSTMFESIAGLVHLNLSHNRLTILPDNAFSNLASLRELDLSFNFLRANFKVSHSYFFSSLLLCHTLTTSTSTFTPYWKFPNHYGLQLKL